MTTAIIDVITDLQIGDKVRTVFSGGAEVFEVYDIKTVYSLRDDIHEVKFKLKQEKYFTPWLTRCEIVYPIEPR